MAMFDDLKLKFVHNQTEIAFGKVVFHKDLARVHNIENVVGGGEFKFDEEHKVLTLYGQSHDYGKFDKEIVEQILIKQREDQYNYTGFRDLHEYEVRYE